jgi:hypothetical protein
MKLGRILKGVQTGCWDVRTDGSWNRSFSIQWRVRTEVYVVRTNDARSVWASGRMGQWIDGRPDGMARSFGRLTRNRLFWLQNLLKLFWIVESLAKHHRYIQVILSKQNEANHKLTNSPFGHFGTEITWPVWKYIPGPKIKITPPFCHKGTKGKIE